MDEQNKSILINFVQKNCLLHRDGSNKYLLRKKDGKRLSWVFDFKKMILNAEMLSFISEDIWNLYKSKKFQLGGIEFSGAMMGMGIINYIYQKYSERINCLIVRKKRKKYDQASLIEGVYDSTLPILLLDDTVNSFSTCLSAISSIFSEYPSANIHSAYFILNMQSENRGIKKVGETFVKYFCLFTKSDFYPTRHAQISQVKVSFPSICWKFSSPNPYLQYAVPKSSPIIYKDSILFGSESGMFWSLYHNSGQVKWKLDTNTKNKKGILSSPYLYEDTVFFGNYDGYIFGVDADTGNKKLEFKLCDWIGSSPVVIDNQLFIGTEHKAAPIGKIIKLNLETLKVEWEIHTKNYQHGSPIYSKDYNLIIIGTNDGEIIAIKKDTGEIFNKLKTGGPIKYHAAVSKNVCVFGSFDGGIYFWDFLSNKVVLKIRTQDIVYSRPLIYQGKAFVGSADCDFYIIDMGKLEVLNKFYCGEKIHCSPSIIDNYVYCGVSNGNILKINPVTNQVDEISHLPERITNTIVSADNKLFVYDYTDTMYCIEKF